MIRLNSYAKINLGLQVLYKRKDGYHNINTVFAKIDLADEILITDSDSLKVQTFPDLGISEKENLVYKSAKKLSKRLHREDQMPEILINKKIPVGGGLGGGSSNAAYAMLGLLDYWNCKDRIKEPEIIAPMIGSDVPLFLKKGWAIGKGRGEKLEHFDFHLPFKILVINPNIHINTADAYKNLHRNEKPIPAINYNALLPRAKENPSLLKEFFTNDFEKSIFRKHNRLKQIKQKLYEAGAVYASMTGSGSTMYGLFEENEDLGDISNFYKEYYVKICKFVN